MYAVIEFQGTQVRVEKSSVFAVNRLAGKAAKSIKCKNVLFGKEGSSYFVGDPYVKDAYVECEILKNKRLDKVIAFKYRDRKSSQSKKGHRRDVTELKVKEIHFGKE